MVVRGCGDGPCGVREPIGEFMTIKSPVTFTADIKPLFREKDRDAMRRWFDLWSVVDVRANADDIAERLEDGSMPCDHPWSEDQVELFNRWVAEGAAE